MTRPAPTPPRQALAEALAQAYEQTDKALRLADQATGVDPVVTALRDARAALERARVTLAEA